MKIAKMIVLAATLMGAFQANAICPRLVSAARDATNAVKAVNYSKQINGQGATPVNTPPPIKPAATTGA